MNLKSLYALAVLAAAVTFPGVAAESTYLHVRTATGWQVLNLDQVDQLAFAGGVMTASDASNNVIATVPQATLEKMYVDDSAGLTVPEVAQAAAFAIEWPVVRMLRSGELAVFDEAGALLVRIACVAQGETVDLSAVRPGIVIIKSGNYSIKAAVR